jgi:glycosyltransferase involved in cell wall biosynthesis
MWTDDLDKASLTNEVKALIPVPVHFYLPNFSGGGAERVFVRLANFLAACGIPTHFVVNRSIGPIAELVSPAVIIHELGASRGALALPLMAGFMWQNRPEVVISALTRTNIVLVLAAKLTGSKSRIVVSERNQFSALAGKMSPLSRGFLKFLVRLTYPHAAAVTAVADGVADDIAVVAGVARNKVRVINNPAPDAVEIEAARQAPCPHPWLEKVIPVLIAMGRVLEQKDYATLLRAVAEVNRTRPARLLILGDGPQREAIVELAGDLAIADCVEFCGFQMNRFDYLVRSDLFVLSSITEGFPNALIEAIACGLPAVSTDCAGGGPKGILQDRYPEALTPVGDSESMATAILNQLANPKSADAIAEIARDYSIEAVARQFLEAAGPW